MIEHNSRGFTLIEIVMVIVVLSILGIFTFSFIGHAVKTYTLVKEQRNLYQDGVYIMERIKMELDDAQSIAQPAPTTTTSVLGFSRAHTAVDPSLTVTFQLNGRDLLRNGIVIGRDITRFNVTRNPASSIGDETITVDLELTASGNPSIPPFALITKITPNNYGTNNYTGRSFNGHYYEVIQ